MPNITTRTIRSARPKSAPFFIRDTKLQGFAVKVNPSGSVKFIAEVWNKLKSHRKTVGSFPTMDVSEARREAITFIDTVKSGRSDLVTMREEPEAVNTPTLESLFNNYIKGGRLKDRTVRNYHYREVVFFYLKDWLNKPVAMITKEMVEDGFFYSLLAERREYNME